MPPSAGAGRSDRTLSIYLHVPFCATRCGYCDFNTYTAGELGTDSSQQGWLHAALLELELAGRTLRALGDNRSVSTVFVGGGTPSLLGAGPLVALLDKIGGEFGLAADAEVTTEANPESTDAAFLDGIVAGGFTRLSLGMQSAAPHVLAVLDRTHTPGRPQQVVAMAKRAGLAHLSLDLIYGTPTETEADFADSLSAALAAGVDHVSAYSLIVEPGTRMARQVARGELPMPDDDLLADRYLQAEAALSAEGLSWYEVSNWAASDTARCRHNLAYWRGGDWWGIGPGAHSHVGGVRWWNVKHPAAYAQRLNAGRSPAQAREVLDQQAQHTERVLLGLRLAEGLPVGDLDPPALRQAEREAADGLLDPDALAGGRLLLTLRGRLLADGIALRLLGG
nr:radical SAM family heme chaperone HemW [Nakamurella aerolata]